jgi:hypothetical protein
MKIGQLGRTKPIIGDVAPSNRRPAAHRRKNGLRYPTYPHNLGLNRPEPLVYLGNLGLNFHSATYNSFYFQRHLLNRTMFKQYRNSAFESWNYAASPA